MNSPAKKVRIDYTGSYTTAAGAGEAPGSPVQATRTGANFDAQLAEFGLDTVSTPAFFSTLPSQLPSSRGWSQGSPSYREGASLDGFSFAETLSPGLFPARPAGTHSGTHSGGHGDGRSRISNSRRLSGNGGLLDSMAVGRMDLDELGDGIMGDGGIALLHNESLLEEEPESILSSTKKALKDKMRRVSKAGRATPDVSHEDTEATRHGLTGSSSTHSFSSASGGHDYSTRAPIGTAGAPAFPFSSGHYLSSHHASSKASGSSSSDAPGSADGAGFGSALSRSGTKASTTGSVSTVLDGDLDLLAGTDAEYAAEGDGASGNDYSSQRSDGSLLHALTTVAESMKPSSGSKPAAPGSAGRSSAAASSGSAARKSATRRSYIAPAGAHPSGKDIADSAAGMGEGGTELSNMSYETGSSGNSNSNSNSGLGLGLGNGRHSVPAVMPSFSTPAMLKLTSAMAASVGSAKPSSCNCKKSRCLKMYCDCFRLTQFCKKETCRCVDCANVESKGAERQAAIDSIVDRNPGAFKPRVTADPASQSKTHLTGCHCRKSFCLKKYCECFTAAVPCTERCHCVDCKNLSDIYRQTPKQRMQEAHAALLGASAGASSGRKDSVGSDTNLDVMSAIMQDKRQQYQSQLALGAKSASFGPGFGLSLGAGYFDPEMSNLSNASASSLNYSRDAFGHGHMYGASPGRLSKSASDSKLAFSSPKAGTDPSSGANSNRSILDNEEAAEVLSVMSSPNKYMTMTKPFPDDPFARYRDTVASSVGSSSGQSGLLSQGFFTSRVLGRDLEGEAGDDQGASDSLLSPGFRMGDNVLGGLTIETPTNGMVPPNIAPYFSSSSAYASPVRPPRIPDDDAAASLLTFAGAVEEEQRKSQLNSPVYQRP